MLRVLRGMQPVNHIILSPQLSPIWSDLNAFVNAHPGYPALDLAAVNSTSQHTVEVQLW